MVKLIEASFVRDVREHDWSTVHKTAGRNGASEGILDRRMRTPRTGAATHS